MRPSTYTPSTRDRFTPQPRTRHLAVPGSRAGLRGAAAPMVGRGAIDRLQVTVAEAGRPSIQSIPDGRLDAGAAVPIGAPCPAATFKRRRVRLATLRLVREGSFTAPDGHPGGDVPIRSPRDVYAFMAPYADREIAESFWVLLLDSQHCIVRGAPTVITRGILNSSLVHPREVFRVAIMGGAAAVVLVHNHPSGDPTPSADDRTVTDQLVAAGRLLDMPVHDHVIIGRGRYTSFAEAGLL